MAPSRQKSSKKSAGSNASSTEEESFSLDAGCLYTIFCLLHGIEQTLYYAREFAAKMDIDSYIEFAYHGLQLITTFIIMKLIWHGERGIRTQKAMDEMKKLSYTSCVTFVTYPSKAVDFALATVATLFGVYSWRNWTFRKYMLSRNYAVGQALILFDSKHTSGTQPLFDEQVEGSPIGLFTFLVGLVGTLMAFLGTFVDLTFHDIIKSLAIIVRDACQTFIKHNCGKSVESLTTEEKGRIMFSYVTTKELCNSMNEGMSELIKVVNVRSFFLMVHFFLRRLRGKSFDMQDVVMIVNLLKEIDFYRAAVQASETNTVVSDWLKKWGCRKVELYKGNTVPIEVMQDELRANPLGIGRKGFFINEDFILKLLGMVAIAFLVIAASTAPNTHCKQFMALR